MKNFFWIFTHYFKRNLLGPANLLLIIIPLILIFAYDLQFQVPIREIATATVLGFLFFGADLTSDWLHRDLKGITRSRLLISGTDQRVFFLSIIASGVIFNIFYSTIVVIITSFILEVDWGNYVQLTVVLLFLSLITQLVGVLIFRFTKSEKAGSGISFTLGQVIFALAVLPIMISHDILETIASYLPAGLGLQIIGTNTDVLLNFAMLSGWITILAVVVFFVGRHKDDSI